LDYDCRDFAALFLQHSVGDYYVFDLLLLARFDGAQVEFELGGFVEGESVRFVADAGGVWCEGERHLLAGELEQVACEVEDYELGFYGPPGAVVFELALELQAVLELTVAAAQL
jgi:hypothetical protein